MKNNKYILLPSQLNILNCLDEANYNLIFDKLDEYFETNNEPSFDDKRNEVIFMLIVNELNEPDFEERLHLEYLIETIEDDENN
jgi:hypothetical protein